MTATLEPPPERERSPQARRLLVLEVVTVVLVAFGRSAVNAAIDLVDALTRAPLAQSRATLNGSAAVNHWIDLAFQVSNVTFGLLPVLLVAFVLARGGEGFGAVGFDRSQPGRDLARGALVAAAIGGAGLALYLGAHALGLAVTVVPSSLPDVWWRTPVLIASAAQNGLVEEVIVVGYLLRRLGSLGWSPTGALVTSALLRGSYHLYQGFGAFAGNAVMGVVFVLLARRWGRVVPLFVAHTLIDVVAFVGYAELAGRVSWLPT